MGLCGRHYRASRRKIELARLSREQRVAYRLGGCLDHSGTHRAECAECAGMLRDYLAGWRPNDRIPKEDRADARRLVATLKEMDTYDLARRCEFILARHHGPAIDVRPERDADESAA